MPMVVLAVGANAVDSVLRLPATPSPQGPNAKLRIRSQTRSAGGQSATAMCGVRALGHQAMYVGALGSDETGSSSAVSCSRAGSICRTPSHAMRPTRRL